MAVTQGRISLLRPISENYSSSMTSSHHLKKLREIFRVTQLTKATKVTAAASDRYYR